MTKKINKAIIDWNINIFGYINIYVFYKDLFQLNKTLWA